ncbi:MAG: hypothetical protein CO187_04985 [Zetaproteobacteria bacterium CG_4_9_14_3_um_filter_53_7]|nr:MAG: hypothetical protein CO187_04985 [Zetaproteobacteria bacterium CG_4_9_14_3_um_filter_53_7]
MYEFSYLYGTMAFAPFWFYSFWVRPDLRSTMLVLSSLFGIGGVLSEFIYSRDWWEPVFFSGTTGAGIEDFLFGFFFSGSVAVFYEIVFNKTYETRDVTPQLPIRFRYIALFFCTVFFGSALILGLHSFSATVLAFGISIVYILTLRKDLLPNAIIGALFSSFLALLFFGIPELLTMGWVESTWSLHNLSGNFILHMPAEDFIWFLLAGAYIAPLHKFWKNNISVAYVAPKKSRVPCPSKVELATEKASD